MSAWDANGAAASAEMRFRDVPEPVAAQIREEFDSYLFDKPLVVAGDPVDWARVEIAVRRTDASGIAVRYADRRLEIAAQTPSGLMLGAYAFLRRVGVEWYLPGPEGRRVPDTIVLHDPGLTLTPEPRMAVRGAVTARWGARLGNNFLPDLGYDMGQQPAASPLRLWPGEHIHTMDDFLPTAAYRDLIHGAADSGPAQLKSGVRKSLWKLRVGDPQAASALAASIQAHASRTERVDGYIVSPLDGRGFDPDAAQRGVSRWQRYSRAYLRFYARADAALERAGIGAHRYFYFYHYYNVPPAGLEAAGEACRFSQRAVPVVAAYNAFPANRPVDEGFANWTSFAETLDRFSRCFGAEPAVFGYLWKLNWLDLWWPRDRWVGDLLRARPGLAGYISQNNPNSPSLRQALAYFAVSRALASELTVAEARRAWFEGLFPTTAGRVRDIFARIDDDFASGPPVAGRADRNFTKVYARATFADAVDQVAELRRDVSGERERALLERLQAELALNLAAYDIFSDDTPDCRLAPDKRAMVSDMVWLDFWSRVCSRGVDQAGSGR